MIDTFSASDRPHTLAKWLVRPRAIYAISDVL
jgi:hypothetical protein